jgi:hypothetical protein
MDMPTIVAAALHANNRDSSGRDNGYCTRPPELDKEITHGPRIMLVQPGDVAQRVSVIPAGQHGSLSTGTWPRRAARGTHQ